MWARSMSNDTLSTASTEPNLRVRPRAWMARSTTIVTRGAGRFTRQDLHFNRHPGGQLRRVFVGDLYLCQERQPAAISLSERKVWRERRVTRHPAHETLDWRIHAVDVNQRSR